MGSSLIIIFVSLIFAVSPSHGYDALDPKGNITIVWDLRVGPPSPTIQVTIKNMQQYRPIEKPGWRLSWDWPNGEVIWDMRGAEATEQGNCSAFQASATPPHCCLRKPVVVDLLTGAPYNRQVANCCRGGVIPSLNQDDSKYISAFQMSIGYGQDAQTTEFSMPENFTLGIPGYTCRNATSVAPSKYKEGSGRRTTQAIATWNVVCVYSQFKASAAPKCCVSLSAFYNETVVPCQRCSCGCQSLSGTPCVKSGTVTPLLQKPQDPTMQVPPVVQCTKHMCPIKVHWHVKVNYKLYWRVKITITNFNMVKNYSDWSLVVLHPNLNGIEQIFSFTYKPLQQYGYINDSGVFYGLPFYNDVLLQSGQTGNVQSEILLRKDNKSFTFNEGWAFPRKIIFNGDDCVMPSPDDYPRTPDSAAASAAISIITVFVSLLLLALA